MVLGDRTLVPDDRYRRRDLPTNPKIHTSARPPASRAKSINHGGRKSESQYDLDGIDPEELAHLVRVVLGAGDAVTFSLTSDGGALSTVILSDGVRHKTYAHTPDKSLVRWSDLMQELYD